MKLKFLIFAFVISSFNAYSASKEFFRSEVIEVFEIIDHLSNWHPLSRFEYREFWKRKFNLSVDDQKQLMTYAKIRKKYQKPHVNEGLFPDKSIPLDLFSASFYKAKSMNEAFSNLEKVVMADELVELKKIHLHFKENLAELIKEGQTFNTLMKDFQKKIRNGKGLRIVKNAMKFFNIDRKMMKKPRFAFVWWPEHQRPQVDLVGDLFLLRMNPLSQIQWPDFEVIQTRMLEALMDAQSVNQRDNFSKQFQKECQVPAKLAVDTILKRPLALSMGGMVFKLNRDKKKFDPGSDWSPNPWVQLYSQVLYTQLEATKRLKEGVMGAFILQSGRACQQLVNLGGFLP